jgi:hypothetical protein
MERLSPLPGPEGERVPPAGDAADLLARQRLDAFTHARLWKNPCGFAARFNYIALRYTQP